MRKQNIDYSIPYLTVWIDGKVEIPTKEDTVSVPFEKPLLILPFFYGPKGAIQTPLVVQKTNKHTVWLPTYPLMTPKHI